jgi:hypothetical protein
MRRSAACLPDKTMMTRRPVKSSAGCPRWNGVHDCHDLPGKAVMRISVRNWSTTDADADGSLAALSRVAVPATANRKQESVHQCP